VREWPQGRAQSVDSRDADLKVLQYAQPTDQAPRVASLAQTLPYTAAPVRRSESSEIQITEALRSVGKYSTEDELNCGGCGYESCRDFANALIARNAERMMCATYTRKLAQKKANATAQKNAVCRGNVDEQLKIIELQRKTFCASSLKM